MILEGVREYCENRSVELDAENGREVIVAANEGGHNSTRVDLLDLIGWLKKNRPGLLIVVNAATATCDVCSELDVPIDRLAVATCSCGAVWYAHREKCGGQEKANLTADLCAELDRKGR